MSTVERLQAVMSNRKTPATADQLADRVGVAIKTIQNNLTDGSKLDRWLPSDKVVLSIRDRKTSQRRYMLSSKFQTTQGEVVKVGKRSYTVTDADSYRIHLTN